MEMKLYIDCDPGIDDAFALGYLLTRKNFNIVGIGSVSGNVDIDKVNKNLQLIVSVLKPDVNILKGSSNFIIENVGNNAEFYHGSDGVGDFWKSEYFQSNKTKIEKILTKSTFSKKSAILEMIDLSIKYPHELVIIALGPLTNIALAQLIDPHFGERIKEIFIMGGNFRGPGNSDVYTEAEFNFSMDPEAVQIVLNRIPCPKHIYPIDATGTPIIMREYFDKWKENKVFKEIIEILMNYIFKSNDENHLYDLVLAIIFAHPEVIQKETKKNVTIDLTGNSSRGHIIIDEKSNFTEDKEKKSNFNKFSSVLLIEELNEEKIIEFIKAF